MLTDPLGILTLEVALLHLGVAISKVPLAIHCPLSTHSPTQPNPAHPAHAQPPTTVNRPPPTTHRLLPGFYYTQAYIVENDPDALKVIHKVCSEHGIDYEVLGGDDGNVRLVTESDIERIVNESGKIDLVFTSSPCKVKLYNCCRSEIMARENRPVNHIPRPS